HFRARRRIASQPFAAKRESIAIRRLAHRLAGKDAARRLQSHEQLVVCLQAVFAGFWVHGRAPGQMQRSVVRSRKSGFAFNHVLGTGYTVPSTRCNRSSCSLLMPVPCCHSERRLMVRPLARLAVLPPTTLPPP